MTDKTTVKTRPSCNKSEGCTTPGFCLHKGQCEIAKPLTERQTWLRVQIMCAYIGQGYNAEQSMRLGEKAATLFEQKYTVAEARRRI